jgi:hypothetical protein
MWPNPTCSAGPNTGSSRSSRARLCGSQTNLQRVQVKQMIHDWERQYPGRIDNMLRAMGHVVPSHLMDRNLYPFATIQATGVADAPGDIAFDEEPCAPPIQRRHGAVAHTA